MIQFEQEYRTVRDVQEAIKNGRTTAQAITYDYTQAIRKLNSNLNAYTSLNERSVSDAEILDSTESEQRGPLHGVPIAIKDSIETGGLKTAFGSQICKDYVPARDATVVRRLKDAGAIVLGKTAIPDWSVGFLSFSTLTEISKNPHDPERDPGGSSSGCGSAVAAGMAVASIGVDALGSVRVPASFNGLVGTILTPGRVSRDGIAILNPSVDSPGVLARTVEDCAIVLDAMIGHDPRDDWTSINYTIPLRTPLLSAIATPSLKARRLGVLRDLFGTHPGIQSLLETSLSALQAAGAELLDTSIPDLATFRHSTLIVEPVKAALNQFLAARKELSHLTFADLPSHDKAVYMKLLSNAPDDASLSPHYGRKLENVKKMQMKLGAIMAEKGLDGFIYPTVQIPAPRHEDMYAEKITSLTLPVNTDIASTLQCPAMTIPMGKTRDVPDFPDSPELPAGLELMGIPFRDDDMLAVGAGIEAALKSIKDTKN